MRDREKEKDREKEVEVPIQDLIGRSLISRTWSNELMENSAHTNAVESPRVPVHWYAPMTDNDHHFERRDAPATTDDGKDSPARGGWLKALAVTAPRLRRKRV